MMIYMITVAKNHQPTTVVPRPGWYESFKKDPIAIPGWYESF